MYWLVAAWFKAGCPKVAERFWAVPGDRVLTPEWRAGTMIRVTRIGPGRVVGLIRMEDGGLVSRDVEEVLVDA